MKIAVVRGKFLNRYEMQFFEPLVARHTLVGFGSKRPYHDRFAFPVVRLTSPMDLPEFPLKMPILNRVFIDAHVLFGLETQLKGFDIVHTAETYYSYTYQALQARRRGYVRKVVATILENIPFNNEGITGRKYRKAYARDHLDHLIALTTRTKTALLLEGADERKITVLPHFIDTGIFTPNRHWPGGMGVHKRGFTILFSGRLEAYKGVFDILSAAKLLLTDAQLKEYDLKFVFAGSGSGLPEMLDTEKRLGIRSRVVHTSGRYEEMPAVYREADLFLAPSSATPTWQEQYNTALLEAQSAGLPIVATCSGGIPENVGDAAVIVQPGDPLSLYHAVKEYLLHPKKRLLYAKKARDRAVTVHDKRIGARKLEDIYAGLL